MYLGGPAAYHDRSQPLSRIGSFISDSPAERDKGRGGERVRVFGCVTDYLPFSILSRPPTGDRHEDTAN